MFSDDKTTPPEGRRRGFMDLITRIFWEENQQFCDHHHTIIYAYNDAISSYVVHMWIYLYYVCIFLQNIAAVWFYILKRVYINIYIYIYIYACGYWKTSKVLQRHSSLCLEEFLAKTHHVWIMVGLYTCTQDSADSSNHVLSSPNQIQKHTQTHGERSYLKIPKSHHHWINQWSRV